MILFSHKFGQLGNRLFAFGHLIANCAANNIHLVNLSFDEYAGYFEGSKGTVTQYPITRVRRGSSRIRSALFLFNRGLLKLLRILTLLKSPFHEVIVADLPKYQFDKNFFFELNAPTFQSVVKKKKIIFLFGRFFRDYANFEKYQNEIRSYFKPVPTLRNNIERLAEAAQKNSDVVIGVHIRRGDYAEFKKGKYFYSPEQYAETMMTLKNSLLGKRVTFIICSNERINPAHFKHFDYVTGSGHPVEDLYILAACDFIMGPPSTFSSWAAFYGNKPLYQIMDIRQPISLQNFVHLPPATLYNF